MGEQHTIDSFLEGHNTTYVEQLYTRYLRDPNAVDASWGDYFSTLNDNAPNAPTWARNDWPPSLNDELTAAFDGQWPADPAIMGEKIKTATPNISESDVQRAVLDSIHALMLIRAFRIRGHLIANLDPLGLRNTGLHPELDPKFHGFNEADMDRIIYLDNVLGFERASMREIIKKLHKTYCGTFTVQYMHLSKPEEANWLKERIENYDQENLFSTNGRKAILNKMVQAEGFEKFCHVKYTGTKRFGLDGGEALIPAMEQIIKRGGALGVRDIIIGMPHRGRLNVLVNVMGKPYRAIFNEFLGGSYKPDDIDGSGDVKYHLGASSDREFDGNSVHLSLTANPSHLEAVNPVVLGKARAKGDQQGANRIAVLPVLLHGDAAFAGQGVVAECFGLSGLKGYKTGGTIHIVVNNQIGFTTSPHYSRSSPYPTDIAMMVEAPIFHVNGDDPEAVVHAAKVATEFRQKFGKDVVIDIFCYRRFGHNEGDEPMFTQPQMYKRIKAQKTALTLYTERLVKDGLIPEGEIEDMKTKFQMLLNEEFEVSKAYKPNKADWLDGRWSHLRSKDPEYVRGKTHITKKRFREVGRALTRLPEGFTPHRTVQRILNVKAEMIKTGKGIDWATAEALAFGSLQIEGFPVRLSGQDCGRGTFSQRHSAILDQNTDEKYYPLNNIRPDQDAYYEVIDSMLSEYAVLGYEYGYSLAEPNALTLWEAQFGDFANGAQIMFDQFISSGESKWLRMSGLVMLLPHGFEGQGPEHSSARPERFLQMCAEDNWVVANATTPASYFHILRRQLHRNFRKPLVLMTPKSLLRHKLAVSTIDDFTGNSAFHRILWDDAELGNSKTKLKPHSEIKRVVICSGKVYYDLLEERDKRGIDDVYLLRLEQLYPYAKDAMRDEFCRFPNADFVWCQEEPKNQGAWLFICHHIEDALVDLGLKHTRPHYVGRKSASAPATGLFSKHKAEQAALINDALTL